LTASDAFKEKNHFGLLSLHDAFSVKAPLDVIQLLVETWPDAVKDKNDSGTLPLHFTCYVNAPLNVIPLLVETWPDAVKVLCCAGRYKR
jgi:hypothetical protein